MGERGVRCTPRAPRPAVARAGASPGGSAARRGAPRAAVALGAALLAVLLAAGAAFGQGATTGGAITLTTVPPASEIVPDELERPTRFVIEARGPAGPLRNAVFDVELTAPTSGPFVSTDIPAIEGTTLLKSRFPAPDGRLEFDYVIPIRGTYKLKVQALPGAGATFQPVTQEFDLAVPERRSEIVNFVGLAVGLFLIGAVAGYVLGYFNRAGRAPA
jgi:hypothetical protein